MNKLQEEQQAMNEARMYQRGRDDYRTDTQAFPPADCYGDADAMAAWFRGYEDAARSARPQTRVQP